MGQQKNTRVHARVPEKLLSDAQDKAARGEISRKIRQTLKSIAYSEDPAAKSQEYERPDNWRQIKKRVLQRDDYTCLNCAQPGYPVEDVELHVHHVVPLSSGGTNRISNLVTLCDACHWSVHDFVFEDED